MVARILCSDRGGQRKIRIQSSTICVLGVLCKYLGLRRGADAQFSTLCALQMKFAVQIDPFVRRGCSLALLSYASKSNAVLRKRDLTLGCGSNTGKHDSRNRDLGPALPLAAALLHRVEPSAWVNRSRGLAFYTIYCIKSASLRPETPES